MVDYRITFDQASGKYFVDSENVVDGSIAVNIPDDDKRKRHFVSHFLHKADIEEGLSFLYCISADKLIQINQALFMAALSNMMKCFQSTSACSALSDERFLKAWPEVTEDFGRFKNWRNKHFIHDENAMRKALAFLWISPEECENALGGEPAVIWNRVPIDFFSEGRKLEIVLKTLLQFVVDEIDRVGASLLAEYSMKTRDELLAYGKAKVSLATTAFPDKKRSINE